MRSIAGFNNSAVQGSFESIGLNKLGGAIDQASTGYSNDVQYTEATGGTVYGLGQQVYQYQANGPFTPSTDGIKIIIFPGTVNNLMPVIDGIPLTDNPSPELTLNYSGGTSGYSYIYIDATTSGYDYPVDPPSIISSATQLVSSDSHGYLLLATIYKEATTGEISLWQYVGTSLWTDRIKIGSSTAKYYWGSV